MPSALIILSPGFEEIEAVTVIDLLRRASIQVTIAGLTDRLITGSHNIAVMADTALSMVNHTDFDILVLPGGQPGTNNMKTNPMILKWIQERHANGQWIAAICAAPTVLHAAGITKNLNLTSYPAEKDTFTGSNYSEDNVVIDDHIITSRGVGTAIDFSLAIIAKILDQSAADNIQTKIIYKNASH
ncbi:MAG: DJ-1/PfpI family protein [Calditrichaceae bacterium]|nr:DJ-1/PfpI family protein [Calditrichaceae bacterium]